MSRAEKAAEEFSKGWVCSQAVFTAFSREMGLNQSAALKLASGFGAGMARTGQTCGAVTGAYLAIALKYGRDNIEDEAARQKTYALIQEFDRRFKARHQSVNCADLIGCFLGDPAQYQKAVEEGRFRSICPGLVRSATEIAEALMNHG
ncbi:C_GCAxxG_C_C family protein [candidate division FCPU426 bacterium]|nr:C_GCAxxG_C_C family protein [candidate division FCPU426 bacterium]